jgi:hypothetical protein
MTNHQYFAQLDENNVVIDVAVVHVDYLLANPARYPGRWVETFFDRPDKHYAGVGSIYDETTKDFYDPFLPSELTSDK